MQRTPTVNGSLRAHIATVSSRLTGRLRKRLGDHPRQIRWYEELLPFDPEQASGREYYRWLQLLGGWVLKHRPELFPVWWDLVRHYLEVGQATHQYDLLREDAERKRREFNDRHAALREQKLDERAQLAAKKADLKDEHRTKSMDCATALAKIGLAISPERIHPAELERAAFSAAPSLEEWAGKEGRSPVNAVGRLQRTVKELAGVLLGLAVGAFTWILTAFQTGFLSVGDLQENGVASFAQVLIGAAVLGGAVSLLTGQAVASAILTLHLRGEADTEPAGERWRRLLVGMLGVAYTVATSVLDAHSLRFLQAQALTELAPLDPTQAPELPEPWVHYLMGSIVACSYVLYRASEAWKDCHTRRRAAHFAHQRWHWVAELRQQAGYQDALELAQQVALLERDIAKIQERLEALDRECAALYHTDLLPEDQTRLDAALAPAIGENRTSFQPALQRLLTRISHDGGLGLDWKVTWSSPPVAILAGLGCLAGWVYDPRAGAGLTLVLLIGLFLHWRERESRRRPRSAASADQ